MSKSEKLTRKNAILYHCWQCMGWYSDGKQDCENTNCPLYSFMPYAKLTPKTDFMIYSPTRKGHVKWEDCERDFTEEQLEKIRERFRPTGSPEHKKLNG